MDVVSTAVVLGFLLAFSAKLDDLIDKRPDFKKAMVSTIINFPTEKYSDIVKKSNELFLQLFNIIYESKSKKRDRFVWMWIFISFISSFLFSSVIYLLKISISLENCLILVVIFPSIFIIILIVHIYLENKIGFESLSLSFLVFIIMSVLLIFVFFYIIKSIGIDWQNLNIFLQFITVMIFPISFLIGYYIFNFLSERYPSYLHISPPRVIISSILVITIIALLKKDIAQSFISEFNQIGMILLAYLLLNIFADSISLWETNIILRLSARGRIYRFVLLCLLDLVMSAVIFLAIPLSTDNLDIFFDSMWFKGEKPWLGILFWSTFSTSILFWAFLLAIFGQIVAQKMLEHYVKLNKILPIEEKPFTCLYCFAIVIIMPIVLLIQ